MRTEPAVLSVRAYVDADDSDGLAKGSSQPGASSQSCASCPKPKYPYPHGNPIDGSWCCSEPLYEHQCKSGKQCCLTPGSQKKNPYGPNNDGCEGIARCGTNPTNRTACTDALGIFSRYMSQNIAIFGLNRYGLGVCPSCSKVGGQFSHVTTSLVRLTRMSCALNE